MKDWQARIAETIDFIEASAVFPMHGDKRVAIANLLKEKRAANQISQALSQQMSQGTLWTVIGRGTEQTYRQYRRALILVRVMLLAQNATTVVNAVNAMTDGVLASNLANDINSIWLSKVSALNTELLTFKTSPLVFLATKKIYTFGVEQSKVMDDFIFTHNIEKDLYEFKPRSQLSSKPEFVYTPVKVFHIHVQSYTEVKNNLSTISGSNVTGADLMVTTQLSGCSVMYQVDNDNLIVAHIQPVGTTGYSLCNELRTSGKFLGGLNNIPVHVFGAQNTKQTGYDYLTNSHTYCIGINIGGNWKLYAQQHMASMFGAKSGNPICWEIV